jgi:hypothetical protein
MAGSAGDFWGEAGFEPASGADAVLAGVGFGAEVGVSVAFCAGGSMGTGGSAGFARGGLLPAGGWSGVRSLPEEPELGGTFSCVMLA